jgi:hypothetical protein
MVRALKREYRRPIGVLQDLQGPKLRIGTFQDGPVDLDPTPGDGGRAQRLSRTAAPEPPCGPAKRGFSGRRMGELAPSVPEYLDADTEQDKGRKPDDDIHSILAEQECEPFGEPIAQMRKRCTSVPGLDLQ